MRNEALLFFYKSEYEEALPLFEELYYEDINDPEIVTGLAVCRAKVESDITGAINLLRDCVISYPDYARAHYHLGKIALEHSDKTDNKNFKQAVTFIRKSVELEPANFMYMEDLADIYLQSGNLDSALMWFNYAKELAPEPEYCRMRIIQTEMLLQQRAFLDSLSPIDTVIIAP